MKQFLTAMLLLTLAATACNNDKKVSYTQKTENGTTTTTTVDLGGAAANTDEMEQRMEALKKLQPLTMEQMKALLPKSLNGMVRTDFSANSAMGFSIAEGTYDKSESAQVKLAIYDCAGDAGAAIYGMTYWTKMKMETENAEGYIRTVDLKGIKAVESYQKSSEQVGLTYMANNRLLVMLSGHNIDHSTLKETAQSLHLKTL